MTKFAISIMILQSDFVLYKELTKGTPWKRKSAVYLDGIDLIKIQYPTANTNSLGLESTIEAEGIPYQKSISPSDGYPTDTINFWVDQYGTHYKKSYLGSMPPATLGRDVVQDMYNNGTLGQYLKELEDAAYIMPWEERVALRNKQNRTSALPA